MTELSDLESCPPDLRRVRIGRIFTTQPATRNSFFTMSYQL